MNKITSNISAPKHKDNFFAIDLIRVILAFVILNFHCYKQYYVISSKTYVGGGGLAVIAFFIISGFFCAISASKEKSLPWWKYCLKRVFKLVPMLCLVYLEGVLFSWLLYLIQGKQHFFLPFMDAHGALWFIWSMWIAEFMLYPIVKYCKNYSKFLILAILLISLTGYVITECILTFKTGWNKFSFPALLSIQSYLIKGVFGISSGIMVYYAYKKIRPLNKNTFIKTLFTSLYFIFCGGIIYLMFWKYNTPYEFLLFILFFATLLICFCKLGWLSNKIILPCKLSQFCKTYSLTLYLYHHAIVTFFACFNTVFTAHQSGACAIVASLIFSVPMYYIAPGFSNLIFNIVNKVKKYIQNKKSK